jgi:tRNA(Ile)-lysidine synthase
LAARGAFPPYEDKKSHDLFDIHCIHVNHNLRGEESRADAQAVSDLCASLRVPCRIETIAEGEIERCAREKGCGIEAAARDVRHGVFRKEARSLGADRILIGHNQDDLLELILMRLLRGAGPAGLALMPDRNGLITRPFLSLSRADILVYLNEESLSYRTDSSNKNEIFFRNKIRLRLVPVLNRYFPAWKKSLIQMAGTQRLTATYLKSQSEKIMATHMEESGSFAHKDHGPDSVTIKNFSLLPDIIQEELVFSAIDTFKKENDVFEPDAFPRKMFNPRRDVVRGAAGSKKYGDLGCAEIKFNGNDTTIRLKRQIISGQGFALLIKEKGFYTYNNIRIDCTEHFSGMHKAGDIFFTAALPVLIRPAEKHDCIIVHNQKLRPTDLKKTGESGGEIFSAQDRYGIAALIRMAYELSCVCRNNIDSVTESQLTLGFRF